MGFCAASFPALGALALSCLGAVSSLTADFHCLSELVGPPILPTPHPVFHSFFSPLAASSLSSLLSLHLTQTISCISRLLLDLTVLALLFLDARYLIVHFVSFYSRFLRLGHVDLALFQNLSPF